MWFSSAYSILVGHWSLHICLLSISFILYNFVCMRDVISVSRKNLFQQITQIWHSMRGEKDSNGFKKQICLSPKSEQQKNSHKCKQCWMVDPMRCLIWQLLLMLSKIASANDCDMRPIVTEKGWEISPVAGCCRCCFLIFNKHVFKKNINIARLLNLTLTMYPGLKLQTPLKKEWNSVHQLKKYCTIF